MLMLLLSSVLTWKAGFVIRVKVGLKGVDGDGVNGVNGMVERDKLGAGTGASLSK